jgi:hypothetical protein
MPLPWKSFKSELEVTQALEMLLPRGGSVSLVRDFMVKQGCQCSELVEGVVYCSAPARSRLFLVGAKWLIELHFRDNRLVGSNVTKGLTGP